MSAASCRDSTHHLFKEADHYIWVYECCVVSDEGLGDVGHDAGVVPWKAFSAIHLHTETSPGPLSGKTFWYQQVPEEKDVTVYFNQDCIIKSSTTRFVGIYPRDILQQQFKSLLIPPRDCSVHPVRHPIIRHLVCRLVMLGFSE